jgi:hypothetical protein
MGALTVQQMADRVAALMEDRLSIRGANLAEKLRLGGGKLPRRVRAAADTLAKAADMAQIPKLMVQVDKRAAQVAFEVCNRHLAGLKLWSRRRAKTENWALSLITSFLVLAALVAAILRWRGYL